MRVFLNSRPSKEIDWRESSKRGRPFLGHQYIKDGRLYGDKRCDICGRWITWEKIEPKYCFDIGVKRIMGKDPKDVSACQDWVHIREKHLAQKSEERFSILLQKGLVK